ncbi:MAG: hypothetical protein HY096_06370 [Nitrospinae bacterium]|nr:hypothetical protein [Nitrospinota bacterium]
MNNTTPIIFIHKGYSGYLYFSLKQARYSNPDTDIYIIGDKSNDRFNFIRHVLIDDYSRMASSFEKVYKHYSTNSYQFELFCIQRWFILSEFMEREKIKNIFMCDSDLMIYCDISEQNKRFEDYIVSYCYPNYQDNYRWSASAHNSFWTSDAINSFCSFIFEIYTTDKVKILEDKWNYHISNKIPGGICDMTLLYLFAKGSDNKICNLLKVMGGSVYDDNINCSENYFRNEYQIKNNKKEIVWEDNHPYCYNTNLNRKIKFLTLHFQGSAKQVIHRGYRGNDYGVKVYSLLREIMYFIFKKIISLITLQKCLWQNNRKCENKIA